MLTLLLQGPFMFRLDLESLAVALSLSLLFDLYISWLLHLRYGKQFGISFILSGIMAFSMPCFLVVGIPVYLILAAQASPALTLILLTPLFVAYLVAGLWLKRKILNKIFTPPAPQDSTAKTAKTEPLRNLPE